MIVYFNEINKLQTYKYKLSGKVLEMESYLLKYEVQSL